jgi:hypothetical protein
MTGMVVHRIRDAAPSAFAWVWLGLVIGVSFIAIPSHFQSTLLARGEVFDVNRYTFMLANRVEIGAGVLLLALLAWRRAGRLPWLLAALVALIVAAQALWLIPALVARGDLIIAGQTPPASPLHAIAVGGEAAKMLALAAIAVSASRRTPSAASR